VAEPVTLPGSVRIREVGPRDGIQSEPAPVATQDKIKFLDLLSESGLSLIEAVSFVSPKAVPQMADARDVWAGVRKHPNVFYSALVPNRKGAEIAAESGVDGMQVFLAATESYNQKNVGKSVRDSLEDVRDVVDVGQRAGLPVEGTISTVFGDPMEGDVEPERVVEVSRWMLAEGIGAISYGDTTGMGTPTRVRALVEALRIDVSEVTINFHFHDTRGTGLANVLMALQMGVDYFDSSAGGMGGSPFAAGSTGNIVTEDLVHMLEDMGVSTGVDLDKVLEAARFAQSFVEGDLPSKLLRAGPRWQTKPAADVH
jgi:hydroxymethylglutaryl-CoA lyase